MDLGDIDPRLVGQGPMSHISYDSHVVTRQRMVDEMPRGGGGGADTYDQQMMEGEIQRVSRELYKAFSGMNQGFAEVSLLFLSQVSLISLSALLAYFVGQTEPKILSLVDRMRSHNTDSSPQMAQSTPGSGKFD